MVISNTKEYRRNYYQINMVKIKAASLKSQNKAIEEKRFYCDEHNVAYINKKRLQNHLSGYKHNKSKYVSYSCEVCNYLSKRKEHLRRHNKTSKHKYNMIRNSDSENSDGGMSSSDI